MKKGTAVARIVATNEVPEMMVPHGTIGALQTQRWTKEGHMELTIGEGRKILFEMLELSGLNSWMEENKERALNLLAKYHDIFTLEDEEMDVLRPLSTRLK